jgi:uncharacterized protein YvpB
MRRKILDLKNNTQVEVLKVPWFPQQEIEWTCLVNSLKMCLEYMKNTYNNHIIRDIVPNMSIDEIMKITNTRRFTGTNVDYQLIKNLNTKIEGIKFSLEENIDLIKLSKKLEKGIPSILIYNCQFLTMGIRGAGHAGVIIGITESDIIVNNPWLGSEYFISHENFIPAWELEYNQAILLEPNPQTKLGSEGK